MADGTEINLDLLPAAYRAAHALRLVGKVNRRSSRTLNDARYRAVAQWADGLENAEVAVQERLSGHYLNAREFGAVGDGSTDDTEALQDAIDALETRGVRTLVIPPGTYRTTGTLEYDGEITISGAGAQSTIIAFEGAGYAFAPRVTGERSFNVRFQEMTVDVAVGDGGIDLTDMSLAKLSGVVVFGSDDDVGGGFGFHVAGTTNGYAVYNRFDHCRALTCERGFDIAAIGSNDTHLTDCRATNCLRGVSVVHANHVVVEGSCIEDCEDGVWIEAPSANVADALTVAGCRFEGNTTNFRAGGTASNIRAPNIHGNHSIGGVSFADFDTITTANISGNTGGFASYERIITNLAHASGVVMHRERTTAGTGVPFARMWDSNTGSGTPTTFELAAGRNAAHVLSIGSVVASVVTENAFVTAAGLASFQTLAVLSGGAAIVGASTIDGGLSFLGAADFIQLGSETVAGNAQIRFSKPDAGNQSWARWQATIAGVPTTRWTAQFDSSENWNVLDGGGTPVLQLERAGGVVANMFVRANAGFRVGAASTGPTITTGTGVPGTSQPDGSIFLRTDGAAGTTLYIRAGGAWTALT